MNTTTKNPEALIECLAMGYPISSWGGSVGKLWPDAMPGVGEHVLAGHLTAGERFDRRRSINGYRLFTTAQLRDKRGLDSQMPSEPYVAAVLSRQP